MHRLSICALLAVALGVAVKAGGPPAALTIVLEFKGPYSARSVETMKSETESILHGAPLALQWRTAAEVRSAAVDHLVVFHFKGKCILEPVGYLMDERGPLAYTFTSDRVMQPFGEVACDQVTAVVRPAMWGHDYAKADFLLGRALGRVVAHELMHMISKSGTHGREGLGAPELTGQQLIAPVLQFSAADLDRIYTLP
jgi:hypothetical protein